MAERSDAPAGEPSTAATAATAGFTGQRRQVDDETQGFVDFYRVEISRLVTFLLFVGSDLETAADIAQETMIDAYRQWATVEHPRTWVRRVASRKYGRHIADVQHRARVRTAHGAILLNEQYDPLEWAQHDDVLRLLGSLPGRQRQVMAWTFDGYPPREIAAELQLSSEAVRGSLAGARRSLARLLQQAQEADDER